MKLFGLTGGIGVGKSTTVSLFHQHHSDSVTILDSDQIAHLLQRPGTEAMSKIREQWPSVVDEKTGELHRERLSDIVFAPTEEGTRNRRILDSIMQPRIMKYIFHQIVSLWLSKSRDHIVIVDAPSLLEMKRRLGFWLTLPFSGILVVSCSAEQQLRRLVARGAGCTVEQATQRINVQMPLAEKEKLADYVIRNNKSAEELREEVARAVSWMKHQSTTFNGWNRLVAIVAGSALTAVAAVSYLVWRFVCSHK